MRKLLNVSLALLATASAAAQAQTPVDTATAYKHQLGLTASPVLDGFFKNNRSLPLGLLYKRQVRPNRAFRVRLVGQYSSRDTVTYASIDDNDNQTRWQAGVFVGYEWQRVLSRRVKLVWGVELGAIMRRQVTKVSWDLLEPATYTVTRSKTSYTVREAQGRPFVGLSYRAGRHLLLLAESGLQAGYRSIRDDRSGTITTTYYASGATSTGFGSSYYHSNTWFLTWQPVQLVGACLTF